MHRGLLQTHAKYAQGTPVHFVILLLASKVLRTYGNFLSYDLLKVLHIVHFLFITKLGSSLLFVVVQKPFSSGASIPRSLWWRIVRHALFSCLITLISLFGLSLCGPLRQTLLIEHGELTLAAAISALASGVGGPAKSRGALLFIVAILSLLLLDNDIPWAQHPEHPEGHHSTFVVHFFYHVLSLVGVADHKGGVALLCFCLFLRLAFSNVSKRLAVDVGGQKRLHALSSLVSAALLSPWAVFISFTKQSMIPSSAVIFQLLSATFLVYVFDYYMSQSCSSKMEGRVFAKYSFLFVASSALVFALFWTPPAGLVAIKTEALGSSTSPLVVQDEHVVSTGVVISYAFFAVATHILLNPNSRAGSRQGQLVGYSPAGLPFYALQTDNLWGGTGTPPWVHLKNFIKQVLDEPDSRKIFYYLLVNMIFTFVEFIYGFWTNSLGLISDGFHMLFDCSALIMGLAAAMMSKWKPSRVFSFGYDRVEILSGFVNGLFLIVIAFFVFTEAITRLVDPPEVSTDRLMTVSVAGLLVNLFGIFVFRGNSHGHSHGGMSCPSSGGSGSHGHASSHGHSHGGAAGSSHSHSASHSNANMEGVFLHVLADTLGSCGVIVSSFLIGRFGWLAADPICSLFIACLIFASVIPLLKSSAQVLLLRAPVGMETSLSDGLVQIQSLDGVLALLDYHFWRHSASVVCGTLHLQVVDDVNEQKLVNQISLIFKEVGVNNLTIQTMKGAFFAHKAGMADGVDPRLAEVAQRSVQGLPLDPHTVANIVKAV